MKKLHVSLGNSKLGKIPSVSFPPIVTCRKNVPCSRDCYAMKAYRQYPNVRSALGENLELWNESPRSFYDQLCAFLEKKPVSRFRFCVSGDAPTSKFFTMIIAVAFRFPDIKFLMYTKRSDLLSVQDSTYFNMTGSERLQQAPENLTVRYSLWYGERSTGFLGATAGITDPKTGETSIFDGIPFTCSGDCRSCSACWDKRIAEIRFIKH